MVSPIQLTDAAIAHLLCLLECGCTILFEIQTLFCVCGGQHACHWQVQHSSRRCARMSERVVLFKLWMKMLFHTWPVHCRKELTEEAAQKAAEAAEPDKKGKDKKKK